MLKITRLSIPDVLLLTPSTKTDHRGDFSEVYSARELAAVGVHDNFVIDNCVRNVRAGVLRGLHFQRAPMAQSKLIQTTRGSVFDVAVDIRPNSPTFGQHIGVKLSARTLQILYIPEGFAHGFCVLEDQTDVHYKVNRYPEQAQASGIRWCDPELAIEWPLNGPPILADRDINLPLFSAATNSPYS